MRAYIRTRYGGAERLQLVELPKPEPKEDEVLIKVKAVSINPLDWHIMRGTPYFIRFITGVFGPKNKQFGADFAGEIAGVGNNIHDYQVGDRVFGAIPKEQSGAYADYAVTKVKSITKIGGQASDVNAAAMPVAGLTALQGLRDFCQVKQGNKVLINGASGGVGTYAVQIAKWLGAEVTGVCSTKNLELVTSIGADHVIDYTKEDFSRGTHKYDVIYEAVGNCDVTSMKRVLSRNGRVVMIGFGGIGKMMKYSMQSKSASKDGQVFGSITAKVKTEDLSTLEELLSSGIIKSVIDSEHPFEDLPKAIAYQEKGHARGKVIVKVNS